MQSLFNSVFCLSPPVKPLLTGDKTIKNARSAFEIMGKHPTLKGLVPLLYAGIQICEDFNCNHEASVILKERLSLVAWTFGDSEWGLIKTTSGDFPHDKICELEELLSTHLRYFSRFTRTDALAFLLIGRTPETMIVSFDRSIKRIMDEIMSLMGVEETFAPPPNYKVICDILKDIRKLSNQHMSWEEYVKSQAQARGKESVDIVFVENLRKEVDEVKKFTHDYIDESMSMIQHEAYFIIKQKALRKFWSEKVGHKSSVSLNVLCDDLVLNYLKYSVAADTTVASTIITNLREGLQSEADINHGNIDAYSLAKISRFASHTNENMLDILSLVSEAAAHKRVFLLPGYEVEKFQVFDDPNHAEMLQAVVLQPTSVSGGIIGISGPSLSGKTYRLLYLLHQYIASIMSASSSSASSSSSATAEISGTTLTTEGVIINTAILPPTLITTSTYAGSTTSDDPAASIINHAASTTANTVADDIADINHSFATTNAAGIDTNGNVITATNTTTGSNKLEERDILWVDLSSIHIEADCIARFSSQLFLRKCHAWCELEIELIKLFEAVRKGSVFVLDNLIFAASFQSQLDSRLSIKNDRIIITNSSNGTTINYNKATYDESWIVFMSKITALFSIYQHKINFVIVCDDVDVLTKMTTLTGKMYIGPLSHETAAHMIQTYSPDLKLSGFAPVDPVALEIASSRLPGEIVLLAHGGSLGGTRRVAALVAEAETLLEEEGDEVMGEVELIKEEVKVVVTGQEAILKVEEVVVTATVNGATDVEAGKNSTAVTDPEATTNNDGATTTTAAAAVTDAPIVPTESVKNSGDSNNIKSSSKVPMLQLVEAGISSKHTINSTANNSNDNNQQNNKNSNIIPTITTSRLINTTTSNPLTKAKIASATEIYAELTPDEQLLACCLLPHITAAFDETMVWSMSKKVFFHDLIRWEIAWHGLVESGWLNYNPDIGYSVSIIPSHVQPICSALSLQTLHDWYISHWTDELVAICVAAQLDSSASYILEQFTQNLPHYKNLLHVLFQSKVKPSVITLSGNNANANGSNSSSVAALNKNDAKLKNIQSARDVPLKNGHKNSSIRDAESYFTNNAAAATSTHSSSVCKKNSNSSSNIFSRGAACLSRPFAPVRKRVVSASEAALPCLDLPPVPSSAASSSVSPLKEKSMKQQPQQQVEVQSLSISQEKNGIPLSSTPFEPVTAVVPAMLPSFSPSPAATSGKQISTSNNNSHKSNHHPMTQSYSPKSNSGPSHNPSLPSPSASPGHHHSPPKSPNHNQVLPTCIDDADITLFSPRGDIILTKSFLVLTAASVNEPKVGFTFPEDNTSYTCTVQPIIGNGASNNSSDDSNNQQHQAVNEFRVEGLALEAIIYKLVGKLSPLFDYHFSPAASLHIAHTIKNRLNSTEDGHMYNLACIELAEQYYRNHDIPIGLQEIFPIINHFGYIPNKEFTQNLPAYSGRALIIYGKLLMSNHSLKAADAAFTTVLTSSHVISELPKISQDKQYAIAFNLKEEVTAKIKLEPPPPLAAVTTTAPAVVAAMSTAVSATVSRFSLKRSPRS